MGQGNVAFSLTGGNGGVTYADTDAHTAPAGAPWMACQVVNDAVLASITSTADPGNVLAGLTLPAGFVHYGDITAVDLTSGVVTLYTR